jgi:2,4-diaminopentanoate dehydrogenase
VGFLPFPDFEPTTLEEFKVLGHIMTDTHRCTIAAVAAAAPGIVIYNGVPLILPRGVAELT